MLDAIARLPAASALDASDTAASSTLAAIIDSETVRPEAERRQLTVLFVDLVGSTALSARLDPEAMGELIRAYQKKVAAEVARFEGHVAKYMGDGVLAYFGRPNAHEDDAERAVRAGLAIARSIAGLEAPDGGRLAARVGIATGLVVVGELVGDQEARERAVVGETPNLAARCRRWPGPARPSHRCSRQSSWRGASRRNRWSWMRRPVSPACGRTKVSAARLATCSRRCMAGSPRDSRPPTSRTQRRSSSSFRELCRARAVGTAKPRPLPVAGLLAQLLVTSR
jgi:class 3 adenylate cyclase